MKSMPRKNDDKNVNNFGKKLITLCKQHDVQIVNGRLDSGTCTCFSNRGNVVGASLVDYLITNVEKFSVINEFRVLDLNEFSDHCPLQFNINFDANNTVHDHVNQKRVLKEKIVWNSSESEQLIECLNANKDSFKDIVNQLMNDTSDINETINDLSELIHRISTEKFGKKFWSGPKRYQNTRQLNVVPKWL